MALVGPRRLVTQLLSQVLIHLHKATRLFTSQLWYYFYKTTRLIKSFRNLLAFVNLTNCSYLNVLSGLASWRLSVCFCLLSKLVFQLPCHLCLDVLFLQSATSSPLTIVRVVTCSMSRRLLTPARTLTLPLHWKSSISEFLASCTANMTVKD